MAKRGKSIRALLTRAEKDLSKVEGEYDASLRAQEISEDLKIDIKNLCENLRSVLDYLAREIKEQKCPTATSKGKLYFPIRSSQPDFEGTVNSSYPDLKTNASDIWACLESVQPYHPGYAWLQTFNSINNGNKHDDLEAQTRSQTERVTATSRGSKVSWNPGAVTFGSGVSIQGVPVDPRTQMPVASPTQTVERQIWVDFRFASENVSALQLLRDAQKGITKIAEDLLAKL